MKKIVITVDKYKSAIDRLANMVQDHNKHLDIKIVPVHPKRPSQDQLNIFAEEIKDADLWDVHYWKTGKILMERFPELTRKKKKLLVHHNPYDLDKEDWKEYDKIAVKNRTQQNRFPNLAYTRLAVDLNFFQYKKDYCTDKECERCPHKCKTIGMVAARIEGNKGISEVAEACYELGYKFILVGRISSSEYFQEIMKKNPDTDFREDVTEEELKKAYYDMSILVVNSRGNFETGPMPILEAMACGIPVLARNVGLVPDINNGRNMVVRGGEREDVEDIKKHLMMLMAGRKKREEMRKSAWNSVRHYNAVRMAKEYADLYNDVYFNGEPQVSIIIPTHNRKETLKTTLMALKTRMYDNIEVVVVDDNSTDGTESLVKGTREEVNYPIKYANTQMRGYNLATARNIGAEIASGHFLVFCDDRLTPKKGAIEAFVTALRATKGKVWYFGDKGSNKKSFVENFSAIKRIQFVEAGMFNERMTFYGGMTQDAHLRFGRQGFKFSYLPDAKAEEVMRSGGRYKTDQIWRAKQKFWQLYYRKQ